MISCSHNLGGYAITENLGVVTGIAIRTRTIENIAAWHIQSLLGARDLTYLKLSQIARKNAFEDMIKNAE